MRTCRRLINLLVGTRSKCNSKGIVCLLMRLVRCEFCNDAMKVKFTGQVAVMSWKARVEVEGAYLDGKLGRSSRISELHCHNSRLYYILSHYVQNISMIVPCPNVLACNITGIWCPWNLLIQYPLHLGHH
jgi:hypothetical protein